MPYVCVRVCCGWWVCGKGGSHDGQHTEDEPVHMLLQGGRTGESSHNYYHTSASLIAWHNTRLRNVTFLN